MKKILLFLAVGLTLSASAHPNHNRSDLSLKLYDNGLFTVMLDNECLKVPSTNFHFNNLRPGNHHLKVIRHYPAYYGFFTPPKIIFNGLIKIPAGSKVFAIIDLYNDFEIISVNGHAEPACYYDNDYYYENSHCEVSEPPVPLCMNPVYFSQLKNTIMNATFESDKLKIARQGIAAHGISSKQVLELMELFTFESSRVKLAKYAYQYTLDKPNYFIVNDGFTFSSSIQELNKYISVY